MFYEVIPEGKVGRLTYEYDPAWIGDASLALQKLEQGQIVTVPLGRRVVPGVVVKKVVQPDFRTKKIKQIIYSRPLPKQILAAIKFISEYYMAAEGEAVNLVLPRGVEKKRRIAKDRGQASIACPSDSSSQAALAKSSCSAGHTMLTCPLSPQKTEQTPAQTEIRLNTAQKNALKGLVNAPGATRLLLGVTGSGKTNIYLEMAKKALKQQKSTILLVPEIALTGQLVRVFWEVFGDKVTLIHSQQKETERHQIFNSLLNADGPRIVIGPRSALFAPVSNLGLIIIDEEHESSYYQENAPRYSAVRVASSMAAALEIPLILGSATPTVEDFYLAEQKKTLVRLAEKAKSTAVKPKTVIIDLKDRDKFRKNRYFSSELMTVMERNLREHQQTLIFHNRRGSSTMTVCENCGEEILCPNCFLPLTLHADEYKMACHTCEHREAVPTACPKCGAPGIVHKGFGTKLLEAELNKLFPKATVRRFDADNKKEENLAAVYSEVKNGEVDIIVGTQTVAKGLDLPRLATVGVVQADAGLALPDYTTEERVFQLLTQVMGRVGRGHIETAEVYIQTYRPEHPVINLAINEDYEGFSKYMLGKRKQAGFPPFMFILKLEITLKTERIVLAKVRETVRRLMADKRLIVSPPQPSFHERTARGYTWQIIVRSRSRRALVEACEGLDKNFKIYLDPPTLL